MSSTRTMGKLRNWLSGIRGRTFLALLVVMVMLTSTGIALVTMLRIIETNYNAVVDSHVGMSRVLSASARDSELSHTIIAYVETGNSALKLAYGQIGERLSARDATSLTDVAPDETAVINELQLTSNRLGGIESSAIDLMAAGKRDQAEALLADDSYRSWETYFNNSVRQYNVKEIDDVAGFKKEEAVQSGWIVATSWSMAAIIFLVCLMMAVVLMRAVIRPIITLEAATQALSRGQLDTRVPVTSHDELGRLAVAFNKMAVVLKEEGLHSSERLANITKDLGE